jgi:hypothetical protein
MIDVHDGINLRFGNPLIPSSEAGTSSSSNSMHSILPFADPYFVGCITSNVTPEALTEIRREFQNLRLLVSSQTPYSYFNVRQFLNAVNVSHHKLTELFCA